MLLFLYRLFIVGFPPDPNLCKHKFSKWEITGVFVAEHAGTKKTHQSRQCELCGLHEFKVDISS